MLEKIINNNSILAMIIRSGYSHGALEFFTPREYSLQMGSMCREKGYKIQPHIHNKVAREVMDTQEVLFVKQGRVRVDFYSDNQTYLESRELFAGDIIFLASQGHGFEMLEPTVLVEVKTGPYVGDCDKVRFQSK